MELMYPISSPKNGGKWILAYCRIKLFLSLIWELNNHMYFYIRLYINQNYIFILMILKYNSRVDPIYLIKPILKTKKKRDKYP
jgi:hypothetical protein